MPTICLPDRACSRTETGRYSALWCSAELPIRAWPPRTERGTERRQTSAARHAISALQSRGRCSGGSTAATWRPKVFSGTTVSRWDLSRLRRSGTGLQTGRKRATRHDAGQGVTSGRAGTKKCLVKWTTRPDTGRHVMRCDALTRRRSQVRVLQRPRPDQRRSRNVVSGRETRSASRLQTRTATCPNSEACGANCGHLSLPGLCSSGTV
jgi:hypothetical protein